MSKNSADVDFGSTRDAQVELRSGPMVEAQHPAKPFGAFDDVRCRFGAAIRLDQPIIDALVVDIAHAALAEVGRDLIVTEGLAQHPGSLPDGDLQFELPCFLSRVSTSVQGFHGVA